MLCDPCLFTAGNQDDLARMAWFQAHHPALQLSGDLPSGWDAGSVAEQSASDGRPLPLKQKFSAAQDAHVIHQLFQKVDQVGRNEQSSGSLGHVIDDDLHNLLPCQGIQSFKRLVQKEQRRPAGNGGHQLQPAGLPFGKL